MTIGRSGNVQPQLDVREHSLAAAAKRSLSLGLSYSGASYATPTVFDNYSGDVAPIAVTLVHPDTGVAYSATAGGGGGPSGSVTAYIASSVTLHAIVNTAAAGLQESYVSTAATLFAVVNTESPLATVHVAAQPIGVDVSSSVTLFGVVNTESPLATVHIAAQPVGVDVASSVTIFSVVNTPSPQVTVDVRNTVDVSITDAVGTQIRTRTVYVGGVATQLPSIGSLFGGVALNAWNTNVTAVWIGPGSGVTTGIGETDSGCALLPGDKVSIPVDNVSDVWVISSSTSTQVLSLVAVITT